MSRPRLLDLALFVKDIRLEHSVFALPFALLGMLLAGAHEVAAGRRAQLWPSGHELLWILVAMVAARSAAMGFNRWLDRELDARNPRTAQRPLAAQRASATAYLGLIAAGSALLLWAASRLNPLALRLAPLALVVLFGYSHTKRCTVCCHFFVGLALGIAPLAAWVGVAGARPAGLAPYALALAVLLWVGGFDILYATLDVDFDRSAGLYSLPSRWGLEPALRTARWAHAGMVLCLWLTARSGLGLGPWFTVGVAAAAGLLVYEHAIVRPDDLRRVNTAFFTLNGVVGVMLLAAALLDFWRWQP
ncbi:MAG: UbiA family prenyltransferase [Fimbriimonadaceae bacterium]|nr:UbiA family prenyltransferase [Fimbriimonadaceae bacterium]